MKRLALDINGKITTCNSKGPHCRFHPYQSSEDDGITNQDVMEIGKMIWNNKNSSVVHGISKDYYEENIIEDNALPGSSKIIVDRNGYIIKVDNTEETGPYSKSSVFETVASAVLEASNLTSLFPNRPIYKVAIGVDNNGKMFVGTSSNNVTLTDGIATKRLRNIASVSGKNAIMKTNKYAEIVDSVDQYGNLKKELNNILEPEELEKLKAISAFQTLIKNSDFVQNQGNLCIITTKENEVEKNCLVPIDFGRAFCPSENQTGGYYRSPDFKIEIDEIYLKSTLRDLKEVFECLGTSYSTTFDDCCDALWNSINSNKNVELY